MLNATVVAQAKASSTSLAETSLNEIYITAQNIPLIFHEPPAWTYCSCVDFSKYMLLGTVSERWGAAWQIEVNTDLPTVGALVLTTEGPYGHVGTITYVNGDKFEFDESNYERCKKTHRQMAFGDSRIRGYRTLP